MNYYICKYERFPWRTTDSNVGWGNVGPTPGRQYRRWTNVGSTHIVIWTYSAYRTSNQDMAKYANRGKYANHLHISIQCHAYQSHPNISMFETYVFYSSVLGMRSRHKLRLFKISNCMLSLPTTMMVLIFHNLLWYVKIPSQRWLGAMWQQPLHNQLGTLQMLVYSLRSEKSGRLRKLVSVILQFRLSSASGRIHPMKYKAYKARLVIKGQFY